MNSLQEDSDLEELQFEQLSGGKKDFFNIFVNLDTNIELVYGRNIEVDFQLKEGGKKIIYLSGQAAELNTKLMNYQLEGLNYMMMREQ